MSALRQNRSFTCNCASLAYLVGCWTPSIPLCLTIKFGQEEAGVILLMASLEKRVDEKGKSIDHVGQYFPYLTDGLLGFLGILLITALLYLIVVIFRPLAPLKEIEL
jgi:hypothetical protein